MMDNFFLLSADYFCEVKFLVKFYKENYQSVTLTLYVLFTLNAIICTLANSEYPGEMLHNMAFHQGLYCTIFREKNQFYIVVGKYKL